MSYNLLCVLICVFDVFGCACVWVCVNVGVYLCVCCVFCVFVFQCLCVLLFVFL